MVMSGLAVSLWCCDQGCEQRPNCFERLNKLLLSLVTHFRFSFTYKWHVFQINSVATDHGTLIIQQRHSFWPLLTMRKSAVDNIIYLGPSKEGSGVVCLQSVLIILVRHHMPFLSITKKTQDKVHTETSILN